MAFRNAGTTLWIAPRGTQRWPYGWGDDHGQQFASADMKTPGVEMEVLVRSQRNEIGRATKSFVTIRNNGPQWCYYNLQGGGLHETPHLGQACH